MTTSTVQTTPGPFRSELRERLYGETPPTFRSELRERLAQINNDDA